MIGRYGISLQEYRDFMSLAEKEIPVRRGGMDYAMSTGRSQQLWPSGCSVPGIRYDCTMYGGQCGAGKNNYFFANGKVYYCGNCIDLPPVGDSSMSFEELGRILSSIPGKQCLGFWNPVSMWRAA